MGIGPQPAAYSCVGCGRDFTETQVFDIGALAPILRACAKCIGKHGTERLRIEADRILALFEAKAGEQMIPKAKRGKCWHCSAPVLRDPTGAYPMWCLDCERERLRIAEAGAVAEALAVPGGH